MSSLLFIYNSASAGVVVSYGGKNYMVNSLFTSYNANSALLRSQPWWNNTDSSISRQFAAAVNTQLGLPNPSTRSPYFAFGFFANPQVSYYNTQVVNSLVVSPSTDYYYAYAEEILPVYIGPDQQSTVQAMNISSQAVQEALQQRYAILTTVLDYDCKKFGQYGICISFQARGTGYGSMNTGAGVLTASYKIGEKFRVGGFLDYQVASANPGLHSLTDGNVQFGYDNATFGGFIGYNQRQDKTGFEARISGGYNPGKISVTRALIASSEAGSGLAGLNGYGVYCELGWGFPITSNLSITPFIGSRYTNVIRNSYIETFNSIVLYPISYDSLSQSVTTGIGGGRLNGKITEKIYYEIGAGVEGDLYRYFSNYSGNSYIPGLESFSYENLSSWNGVRPFAMTGLTYEIANNHRIIANTVVREQPYNTRAYMSGLVGYQASF